MIKVWRFLSISIVLAVCLGLLLVPAATTAAPAGYACLTAHVPGQPGNSAITISPGDSFDMNVTLDNNNGLTLYGAVAAMEFDASLLNVTGITNGTDWSVYLTATWDNSSGWAVSEAGIGFPIVPLTTNTTQCVVHFESTGVAGSTMVNLTTGVNGIYDTKVANSTGDDVLCWTCVQNFSVTIAGIPQLTVNVTPNGTGTVQANGVTLIGYPNTTNWTTGDNVTLLAVNSTPGWGFANWSGDLSGSTNPDNITMDSDKNVTANFAPLPPQISPDPTSLTFNANVGEDPANQTLDICNGGGGILNWTLTDGPGWLRVRPLSGGNLTTGECNSTQVAVNVTGLTQGTYHANITITANPSVNVSVTLNLGVPAISVSPTSLTFTTTVGVNPPSQTLEVCNSGNGTLDWELTDNAGWLSGSPTSGSLDEDECDAVTVSVDVSGMEAGDYSATITITGSEKKVPVTLHIESAMPEMPVGPASISVSGLSITPQQVQSGRDVTISISVSNTGGAPGSYNAVLYINGAVEDSQSVSVPGGTSKNVIFTVSKTKAGVYDVSLGGQSGQFEVVGGGGWFAGGLGTGGIIAIVVVVIVLIVAVVFILRGTARPE